MIDAPNPPFRACPTTGGGLGGRYFNSMKILILCSENSGKIAPFITEQADSLKQLGVEIAFFTVKAKGWKGYIKSRKFLIEKIKEYQPDLIHAHYGLSGLLANLQRRIPVITTYHGSDINNNNVFRFSKWSIRLSVFNIFVSQKNFDKAAPKANSAINPCGIDTGLFSPADKEQARNELGVKTDEKLIIFAGAFDNPVKNPAMAREAVDLLHGVRLMELKGYTRKEVALLINAADCCLMTSHTEGSPQVIKEAMACNCPIVSVDVGDVKEVIEGVEGCHIAERNAMDVALKIEQVLIENKRTNGREKLIKMRLDSESVAQKIISIYNEVLA